MNLIQIPFHDLRKIEVEGHRTRDAHLMESFLKHDQIQNLLVIDRPTTLLEILMRNKPRHIKHQEVLLEKKGMKLLKIKEGFFAVEWISGDFWGQIRQKKTWFRHKFADQGFIDFIHESLKVLQMQDAKLVSNNIFACDLVPKLQVEDKIFDAWDDFAKIGNYSKIKDFIKDCYRTYAAAGIPWATNAEKNKKSFENQYHLKNIAVITNGVDNKRFQPGLQRDVPEDMKPISPPIYGFGGKITHLIDPELMRQVAADNPDKNFVFVGQKMVPEILSHFSSLPNVHFLGDKHYDDYINYLANFNVCLVPYVDDEKSSGANTIKVYEYLAMGKKVVGTRANGLEDLEEFVYAAGNAAEFSEFLKPEYPNKSEGFDTARHAWKEKANQFIRLLNS